MTTETELRSALSSRAAEARPLDVERLLADLEARPVAVRSTVARAHGQRRAIAGVAAGFVALAVVAGSLVVRAGGADTSSPAGPAATASGAPPSDGVAALASAAQARISAAASAAASSPAGWPVDPDAPTQPRPAASDWQDIHGSDSPVAADDSAVVFGSGITAVYVRAHEQLSVIPAGATAKDNSDARWWTAVQVFLPGSGFDPASIGDPTSMAVDGIDRQFGTLPKVLDVAGPTAVPSLLWQLGDDWIVLQIDTPSPTAAQLAAAAAPIDVLPG